MLDALPFVAVDPHFCPRDGTPLGDELKGGKLRRVCPTCGYIYGRDPRVILGLMIRWADEWLFVKRSVETQVVWCLPLYPCRDRKDARIMLTAFFEAETELHVPVGSAVDTFNIDTPDLGSVLILLFRGTLARADISGRPNLMSAKPASIWIGPHDDLSREIVTRLSAVSVDQ